MSEIPDADRDFMTSYRLAALHSGLAPEDATSLLEAMVKALADARIEGERLGLEKASKMTPALPAPATQEVDELRDAAQMAKTRLQTYADQVNAGHVQGGGRELLRKIWGAFAEFDALTSGHVAPQLHEDTARLDWLEMQEVIIPNKFRVWLTPSDLRAQIDRARAAEKDAP